MDFSVNFDASIALNTCYSESKKNQQKRQSVDPDETACLSRLIWIFTFCRGTCFALQS